MRYNRGVRPGGSDHVSRHDPADHLRLGCVLPAILSRSISTHDRERPLNARGPGRVAGKLPGAEDAQESATRGNARLGPSGAPTRRSYGVDPAETTVDRPPGQSARTRLYRGS